MNMDWVACQHHGELMKGIYKKLTYGSYSLGIFKNIILFVTAASAVAVNRKDDFSMGLVWWEICGF